MEDQPIKQTKLTKRQLSFYPPISSRGKWHAVSNLAGDRNGLCGLSQVSLRNEIVYPASTGWEEVHPICCRHCLEAADNE
jgi:hypothetical protein